MRYLVFIFGIFVLAGCEKANEPDVSAVVQTEMPQPDKTLTAQPFPKPGAAVLFASDFAGDLWIGEQGALVIYLEPQYSSGQIEVEIYPEQGLEVSGDTLSTQAFAAGQQLSYQLSVMADQPGQYMLGIQVAVTTDSGLRETRAFAETISVLDPSEGVVDKNQILESFSELEAANEEIMLEAQERIYSK